MKKATTIVSIVLIVILMLMLFIPMLFKDQISELVKKEINKTLNANVNFGSVGLNVFQSFPDLTLSVDNMLVVNREPFKGDTLLNAASFQTTVDIWSVIKGKQIRIESIRVLNPKIYVHVLKDSSANYNITKPSETKADTSKAMNIALKKYSIEDADITYNDETSDTYAKIKGLYHNGHGDFTKSRFDLSTKTTISSLSYESAGISYLSGAKVQLDMDLDANLNQKRFTFEKNEFRLNNLSLKFDGFIARPDSNITMDLTFESLRTDFKDIVSLIPAAFSKDFNDLKSSGKMSLKGSAKGIYNKNMLPSFNIRLTVVNGYFQYPKLPTPVRDVNMDMTVSNSGGSPDNTIVDMKQLHLQIGSEPFDARMMVKTPKSNPYIDTQMKGRINLAQVKGALPLEDVTKLEGLVQSDFQAKGFLGDIKNKRLANINASGTIALNGFQYASKKLPQEVKISQALLALNPQTFNLSNLNMTIGQNDLSARGTLNNLFGYILNKGVLSGNLTVNSNYFDVNSITANQKQEKKSTEASGKTKAIELPERIDFTMNSTFNKVIFQNLTLQNVHGVLTLRDKKLTMSPLSMNLLGGSLVADGYYYAPEKANSSISFNLNISNFDIGKTYESFVTVKQFAPMAEYLKGNFDAKLSMNTPLDKEMMPLWNSFNSQGVLNLANAQVSNFKPFQIVGNTLKIDELKNPMLTNVRPSFKITNGRFYVSPFSYKVYNYDVTLGGSSGIDRSLDYTMDIQIPAGNLQTQANQAINQLLKRNVNLVSTDKVNVKAFIKGKVNDPVVTTSVSDIVSQTTQTVADQAKQQVNQELQKQKEQVQKQVQQKADTLKDKLKKQAEDKLKDIFKKKF